MLKKISLCLCFLFLLFSQQVFAEAKPYKVVCKGAKCSVDKKTYIGWRTFGGYCIQCHGQDAVGSTFAPDLTDLMKTMKKERFVEVVTNGYQGNMGVMPGWKKNKAIMKKMDHLWGYLKARANGDLKRGRPKKL